MLLLLLFEFHKTYQNPYYFLLLIFHLYSSHFLKPYLLVDLTIGVSYEADIKQTKEVLLNILTSHPKVLKDPAPNVTVSELADSSVNFAVRPWSKTEHYWDVYFEVTEAVKLELDKAGIDIPYPHQVIIKK